MVESANTVIIHTRPSPIILDRLLVKCAKERQIRRVFFYADGVFECLPSSPDYVFWLRLAEAHDVSLSLCPDAVIRRELQLCVKAPFELYGLASFFLDMSPVDRLCVVFKTARPDTLLFREGLDLLLSAASQDWVVKVVFMKPIYDLLGNEEALLAEYDIQDIEVWEYGQLIHPDLLVIVF